MVDPFYTQSGHFALDLAALRTAATAEQTLQQQVRILIEKRNDIQDEIAPILRDYRKAVEARFAPGHALMESLPRYSPVPGTKPVAPKITSAQWSAVSSVSEVAFTPSPSTDVVRHELRVVPGAVYDRDLETTDGTLAVGEPPVFQTSSLLGSPGDVVSYRIYAINGDDQETASDAVSLQRP